MNDALRLTHPCSACWNPRRLMLTAFSTQALQLFFLRSVQAEALSKPKVIVIAGPTASGATMQCHRSPAAKTSLQRATRTPLTGHREDGAVARARPHGRRRGYQRGQRAGARHRREQGVFLRGSRAGERAQAARLTERRRRVWPACLCRTAVWSTASGISNKALSCDEAAAIDHPATSVGGAPMTCRRSTEAST